MITWLVQSNLISEDIFTEISEAALIYGCLCEGIKIIPFSDALDLPERKDILIPYGSTSLIKNFDRGNWNKKGFFFNKENLKTSTWVKALGTRILNYDSMVLPLKDAAEHITIGDWFIKPDDDLKDFTGTFVTPEELKTFYSKVSAGGYLFTENIPVVIAPIKNTGWEFRMFMIENKVIASSSYKIKTSLNKTKRVPREVITFAEETASIWRPDDVYVLDVAETDEGLKVVEFNSFNASGFYNCSVCDVVREVSSYIRFRA